MSHLPGTCSKKFPRPVATATFIDVDGEVQYRKEEADVMLGVTHLPSLSLWDGHAYCVWWRPGGKTDYLLKYVVKNRDVAKVSGFLMTGGRGTFDIKPTGVLNLK